MKYLTTDKYTTLQLKKDSLISYLAVCERLYPQHKEAIKRDLECLETQLKGDARDTVKAFLALMQGKEENLFWETIVEDSPNSYIIYKTLEKQGVLAEAYNAFAFDPSVDNVSVFIKELAKLVSKYIKDHCSPAEYITDGLMLEEVEKYLKKHFVVDLRIDAFGAFESISIDPVCPCNIKENI